MWFGAREVAPLPYTNPSLIPSTAQCGCDGTCMWSPCLVSAGRRIRKVQGHPQLHRESEASLGSVKPCVKRKNKQICFVGSSGEQQAYWGFHACWYEKAQWGTFHLKCHSSCPCTWSCSPASVGWFRIIAGETCYAHDGKGKELLDTLQIVPKGDITWRHLGVDKTSGDTALWSQVIHPSIGKRPSHLRFIQT